MSGCAWAGIGGTFAERRKMAYKATFRPIEGLVGGVWQVLQKVRSARDRVKLLDGRTRSGR